LQCLAATVLSGSVCCAAEGRPVRAAVVLPWGAREGGGARVGSMASAVTLARTCVV